MSFEETQLVLPLGWRPHPESGVGSALRDCFCCLLNKLEVRHFTCILAAEIRLYQQLNLNIMSVSTLRYLSNAFLVWKRNCFTLALNIFQLKLNL